MSSRLQSSRLVRLRPVSSRWNSSECTPVRLRELDMELGPFVEACSLQGVRLVLTAELLGVIWNEPLQDFAELPECGSSHPPSLLQNVRCSRSLDQLQLHGLQKDPGLRIAFAFKRPCWAWSTSEAQRYSSPLM